MIEKKDSGFDITSSLAVKGIAVLLMVAHHLFRTPSIYQGYDVSFVPFTEEFVNELFTYFKICVGIFAFVSGYGLARSYKKSTASASHFVLSRYFKTMAHFWVIYIPVAICVQIADGRFISTYFSGGNVAQGIVYAMVDFLGLRIFFGTPSLCAEWWYMSAAVAFIVLVPVFVHLLKRVGCFATVVSTIMLPRLLGVDFQGGMAPLSFVMPLLLGIIFEHLDLFPKINRFSIRVCKFKWINSMITLLIFLSVLLLSYDLYGTIPQKQFWEFSYGVVPAVFVLFVNRYFFVSKRIRGIFAFVGRHSANIYLVHAVILRYFKPLIFSQVHFTISIVLLFTVSLIISMLLQLIKKASRYGKLIELLSSDKREKGII